jgi:hypothetical protein
VDTAKAGLAWVVTLVAWSLCVAPLLRFVSLPFHPAQRPLPEICANQRRDFQMCGVEVWRGGLGSAYPLPTLSSVGASRTEPCFLLHTPLIEPDVRVSRFRLSEKGSRGRPREIARPLGKAQTRPSTSCRDVSGNRVIERNNA